MYLAHPMPSHRISATGLPLGPTHTNRLQNAQVTAQADQRLLESDPQPSNTTAEVDSDANGVNSDSASFLVSCLYSIKCLKVKVLNHV